jgi:two-component system CheB/CheR fusion protein
MGIEKTWARWAAAAGVFLVATGLNLQLQPQLQGRAPLLPYFPSLVIVGLVCGLGPALALLVASSVAILFFWIAPVGKLLPINSAADAVLMLLFLLVGVVVAGVSAWARQLMDKERRSRRRLHLALAAGRMVAWDWDVAKGFRITADTAREVFGQAWSSFDDMLSGMAPADARRFKALYDRATADGGRFTFACAWRRPDDGEVVWAQFDAEVSLGADGRAAQAYGVVADVSVQQQALRASQAAEERFQLALESGKVMAWECDAQARYTWAFNVPMGFSREALIGAEVGSLAGDPAFAAAVREAVASGRAAHLAQHASHGGRDYHLLTWLRPIRDDGDGPVVRVIGATVDVTELTAVQEELRSESRRKDAFLATLAHELRNPMAPIRYAVEILRRHPTEVAAARCTDIIARQSAHMARLLDDLLDMSRITRNVVELKREIVDMRAVVKQALEAVEPLYAEKKHRLSLSMPTEPVMVDGDPTRLQQVLGNLLDNAAKYTPEPGEVAVHVAVDAGHAQVSVSDNGLGIAPAMQPRVFELFTRIDGSGGAPSGLGIGLAVSRQLLKLHGGTITVESDGVGHGSRFVVCLPLAPAPAAAVGEASPAAVADTRGEPVSVMVVDDNIDGADTLAEVLRAAGYEARVAYSGEEALAACEQAVPRVMLLDIGLPGISGTEVARRLRADAAVRADLVLIAVTGWGQPSDREATHAAGFDAHVVKPVDFTELDALVRRCVADRRQA